MITSCSGTPKHFVGAVVVVNNRYRCFAGAMKLEVEGEVLRRGHILVRQAIVMLQSKVRQISSNRGMETTSESVPAINCSNAISWGKATVKVRSSQTWGDADRK